MRRRGAIASSMASHVTAPGWWPEAVAPGTGQTTSAPEQRAIIRATGTCPAPDATISAQPQRLAPRSQGPGPCHGAGTAGEGARSASRRA